MKRVFDRLSCVKLVMFVLLVSFVVSCNKSTTEGSKDSNSTKEDESAPRVDIAYVLADSLITNYDMYHDKVAEFEKKAKDMESELSGKLRAFQRDATDFQEKYQKGLMTRSQAEEQELKLQQRQRNLEETRNKMTQDLAEQEGVMFRQIQDALLLYIDKYNATHKYSLILNGSSVLYGHKAMDITADILKGMNEEYVASKVK